jgi:hypothetical protein
VIPFDLHYRQKQYQRGASHFITKRLYKHFQRRQQETAPLLSFYMHETKNTRREYTIFGVFTILAGTWKSRLE